MIYNKIASDKLALYIDPPGTYYKIDLSIVKEFIIAGANPLVRGKYHNLNLFEIASKLKNPLQTRYFKELIDTCKISQVKDDDFTEGLANYIDNKSGGIDVKIVSYFVNAGANPLVKRNKDNMDLFQIASRACWGKQSWKTLIKICRDGHVTPEQFTQGLYNYIAQQKYHSPTVKIDLEVLKDFVNAGANPNRSEFLEMIDLRKSNDHEFVKKAFELIELYNYCIGLASPNIAIRKTTIKEFDDLLDNLYKKIEKLNHETKQAGCDLLEQLNSYIEKYKNGEYEPGEIGFNKFRIDCGVSIQRALKTDLAKQPTIYNTLMELLNVIAALTIVLPVISRVFIGHYSIFAKTETKDQKLIRTLSDSLVGLEAYDVDAPPAYSTVA